MSFFKFSYKTYMEELMYHMAVFYNLLFYPHLCMYFKQTTGTNRHTTYKQSDLWKQSLVVTDMK